MTNKNSKINLKRETTNHTNSTNKVKKVFIFYVKKNYIVSSFVRFVLFVVERKLLFIINARIDR